VRILIFHGYLLDGTGSNVYTARLAAALVRQGHEVHLLSQERHPEGQAFVDRAGDWDSGELRVRDLRAAGEQRGPGSCTAYRPAIGGLLPVYVADRYEDLEARPYSECSDAEIARYVAANVAAVEDVASLAAPEAALANHLVMGPLILARGLASGHVPYAVKIHGSALEYTVRPQPERFLAAAREGLRPARTVLVGSRHTAMSLWETVGEPDLPARTRLGPPGVDVDSFGPREPAAARQGVRALAARLAVKADSALPSQGAGDAPQSAFSRDIREAALAIERLAQADADANGDAGPLVIYVGKLIVSKGVDLLAASWPLVLEQVPRARLLVVGFGAYRAALEQLLAALAGGDLEQALQLARAGRALEDPLAPELALRHLLSFLEGLSGERRELYLAAASGVRDSVLFSGRLDHDELLDLLPACDALIAPSTFPEAFGMVAAEAAACGVLPICADHSGLAEVSAALARAVPREAAAWLSFPVDDGAVPVLAERIVGWLEAGPQLRLETREGLVETVRERWSWDGVARAVVTAAQAGPEGLPEP
jgi:glycosyltransferase involved in cell wall biosynthesis